MLRTVRASGGDYTTLAAAEAADQQDLTVLNDIYELEQDGGFDAGAVTFDGWTTDATRYIRVFARAGSEAQLPWSASAARNTTTLNAVGYGTAEQFTRFEYLQCDITNTLSNSTAFNTQSASSCRFVGCVARDSGPNSNVGFRSNSGSSFFINCVAIGDGGASTMGFQNVWGAVWYNCTAVGWATGFVSTAALTKTARNCVAFNCTTDWSWGTGGTASNNASEDGTHPGTSGVTITVDPFVDSAGGDYHIASGSQLVDVGTDLSADATFAFTLDFDRAARSGTWDIGADEYVAAGGGDTALDAALAGSVATTATLSTAITMSSVLVGSGVVASALTTAIRFTSVLTGTGTVGAELATAIRMAAALTGTAVQSADLATIIAMQVALAGSGNVGASLSTAIRFTSQLLGTSVVAGGLVGAAAALNAALAGTGIATGTLATAIRLQAALTGAGLTGSALTTAVRLAAAMLGSGTVTGQLGVPSMLDAALLSTANAQATLTTALRLVAALAGSGITAAQLETALRLAAALQASGILGADLTVRDILPFVIVSGEVYINDVLSGTVHVSDGAVGVLQV